MISQTLNLAPADKKLYALRDAIACVESIPLIASSIMSKKIASGAQKIVLDVTVGKGAFMQTMEDARKLANTMIEIGKLAKRETVCVLTNMDEPLGYAVGNSLEVIEAVKFLKGEMPEDVKQVVLELGSYMMQLAGKGNDLAENKKQMNSKEIGKLAGILGAGREKKEDAIDPSVGIVLAKKVGDSVKTEEIVAYVHANNEVKLQEAKQNLKEIIKIVANPIEKEPVILEIIK